MPPIPNVVLFGAAGSGKSSIINMLAGRDVAQVNNGLQGCTFESTCYEVEIHGSKFNLWDTAGLNEAPTGVVPDNKATLGLLRLLKNLDSGVNLLVFCMRGPRIQDVAPMNWHLFYEIICDRKVRTVMAVTGLELEESMDDWWDQNRGAFEKQEIMPQGVACITAIRGGEIEPGRYQLDEEFAESKRKMEDLVRKSCLKTAWKMKPIEWFHTIVETTEEKVWWLSLLGWPSKTKQTTVTKESRKLTELAERCKMEEEEARALANILSKA